MPYEVELKFRADAERLARVRDALARPDDVIAVSHVDLYLSHPARDFAATGEALRLRSEDARNALTYKGPKRPGAAAKTREEIEVPVGSGAEARADLAALLERLGFRPVAEVRKWRRSVYVSREGRSFAVALDESPDLGCFVEVETLAEGEDQLEEAQAAVLAFAAELGLDRADVEPRSYLRMFLEARGGVRGGVGTGLPGSTES